MSVHQLPISRPGGDHLEVGATRRLADLLLDDLISAGVDTVFGVPGGSIAPICDALLDRRSIRVVTTRHDGHAVFAAAGYAQATGRLGVALVTSGPGVLNTVNAVASAHSDGLPVLLLAGDASRAGFGRGGVQDGSSYALDVVSVLRPISKLAQAVPHSECARGFLLHGIRTAMAPRRGPVLLSIPLDVQGVELPTFVAHATGVGRPEIDVNTVVDVERALQASTSRAVLVGSGCRWGETPAKVRQLVERLGLPVMTTPKAKGVFPESHPLSLGVFGMGGHPSTRGFTEAGYDTLLVLGSSLSELATDGWATSLRPRETLIHVDLELQRFGRSYTPTIAVAAPIDTLLDALLLRLPACDARSSGGVRRDLDPKAAMVGDVGRISPPRALWELQQILPEDTIYTADSGSNLFFAVHYLEINRPDCFVAFLGQASLGSGLPASLGVGLAARPRTVVSVTGDAGFLMCAAEVATAAQLEVPLIVAVLNDERMSMVESGLEMIYGRTLPFPSGPVDIAAIARGCGAEAVRVEYPQDLLRAKEAVRSRRGPLVFDILVDPTTRLPTNRRFDTIKSSGGRGARN
ncbi:MAG: thiamine pyrophosphate-binding protein [Myxococcales bacterium FL481]|nr:MAG: thiamine pyrophosphate-binding protein [Myxococcales bacterium FL481]